MRGPVTDTDAAVSTSTAPALPGAEDTFPSALGVREECDDVEPNSAVPQSIGPISKRAKVDDDGTSLADQTAGIAMAAKPLPAWKTAKASDYAEIDNDALFQDVQITGRIKWNVTICEYRARAHANPLNDGLFDVPVKPSKFSGDRDAEWADIGCGYGGLVLELSAHFPAKHIIGLEIRQRVHEYCELQLTQLRANYPGEYLNASFARTNTQKYLPHYFRKAQLEKLMICYPDPHFKRKKHRQRIVSPQLLAEYAFVLRPGGRLYIVTDVMELYEWMTNYIDAATKQFSRITDFRDDRVAAYVRSFTNEAYRVKKHQRPKLFACYERRPPPHFPL